MGKQGSQQVYFEDEIKPALEGSRNAFPHQTDQPDARKMKILKPPKVSTERMGNGRQSVDAQNLLDSQENLGKAHGPVSFGTMSTFGTTAMTTSLRSRHQDQLIRNYFSKDIQVKDTLRDYRTDLEQRHPDPQKKGKAEDSDQGGKPAPAKAAANAKKQPSAQTAVEVLSGTDSQPKKDEDKSQNSGDEDEDE